jgi:SAM-dependent methyltransferase
LPVARKSVGEEVKEFYIRHYKEIGGIKTDPRRREEVLRNLAEPGHRYYCLFDFLENRSPLTAIELGFGDLSTALALGSVFREYMALDIAVSAIMSGDQVRGLKLIEADLNHDFPLDSATVDVVIAMMVIEHLFDPFHSFREMARICRSGGHVFVNLPIITSIRHRLALLFGKLPTTSTRDWFELHEWDGGHLHYFTIESVKRLARLYGLEPRAIYPVGRFLQIKRIAPSFFCGEVSFVFQKK